MKRIIFGVLVLFLGTTLLTTNSAGAAKEKKAVPSKKKAPPVATEPQRAEGSPVAVPDYPDPAVAEIHQELADIIRVHQSLQVQYRGQVREIQRITDQARAHQKLLKDLETIRHAQEATRAAKTLDDLVRLEKIRLIQEQTHQNRTRLKEIQKQEKEG